jgi:hypothetical protein
LAGPRTAGASARRPRPDGGGEDGGNDFRLYGNSKLACAEGDDAADWIVRRNADGDPVAGHDLDSKSAHTPAELREHFVAGIRLHPVQPAAVDGDNGALDIDQIVLTQTFSLPFQSI